MLLIAGAYSREYMVRINVKELKQFLIEEWEAVPIVTVINSVVYEK